MGQLMLQVLPSDPDDRTALREDFARQAVRVEMAGYEKMIQDNPGDYASHNALALRHYGLGRPEEAVRHFEESVRLNCDFGDGHYGFGTVLARLGRLEEAAMHLEEAVRIDPDRVEVHNNLWGVLHSFGRFATAVAHYRWAAQLDPDAVEAQRNLGVVLRSMGRLDEAISAYRQALERRPNGGDRTKRSVSFSWSWKEAQTIQARTTTLPSRSLPSTGLLMRSVIFDERSMYGPTGRHRWVGWRECWPPIPIPVCAIRWRRSGWPSERSS